MRSDPRYVVLGEVGRGAMGRVLRAYDPKLQREVAIKEVRRSGLGKDGTQRLIVEAQAMAKLSHPNVVAIYDVHEVQSGEVVLVMELVLGQTLETWLREMERPWPQVLAAFRAAGEGLVAAHEAGLTHRDFKPANVLIGIDDQVKVADFGLAAVAGTSSIHAPAASDTEAGGAQDARARTVVGTLRFMPPEQHRGADVDARADQYALCVALWRALCGCEPFSASGSTQDALASALVQAKELGPPAWPGHGVPPRIGKAIRRGLAPDPAARWPTTRALLDALSWNPRQRRDRWSIALGTTLAVSAGGLALHLSTRGTTACTPAPERLAGAWDAARHSEVQAAMARREEPYASVGWARAEQALDRYARDWVAMHVDVCEATTVRAEQSTAVMELRTACLHDAATHLDAVTSELTQSGPNAIRNAHLLTGQLPPLARCADIGALQQDAAPPTALQADRVASVRRLLAKAWAANHAGRYAVGRQAVEDAKSALAGVDYAPLRAEVAELEASELERLAQYEDAQDRYLGALGYASAARQWERMGTIATRLSYVVGCSLGRPSEGRFYASLAKSIAMGDPRQEATASRNLAMVAYAEGSYTESLAEFRNAAALRARATDPGNVGVVEATTGVAVALTALGEHHEARAEFRRALHLAENALGSAHPATVALAGELSDARRDEDGQGARVLGPSALEIFERTPPVAESSESHEARSTEPRQSPRSR